MIVEWTDGLLNACSEGWRGVELRLIINIIGSAVRLIQTLIIRLGNWAGQMPPTIVKGKTGLASVFATMKNFNFHYWLPPSRC